MGATACKFWDYSIGGVAMLPATIVFVFIGTTLASITDAVKGDYEGNTATLVLLIGGSVLALGGVFWISYVVKKYLNQ
jgi:methionine-S-sulfoxide reductase